MAKRKKKPVAKTTKKSKPKATKKPAVKKSKEKAAPKLQQLEDYDVFSSVHKRQEVVEPPQACPACSYESEGPQRTWWKRLCDWWQRVVDRFAGY